MLKGHPAVDVWIYKPNVVHRQIFGSRVNFVSDCLIIRTVYPKLYTGIEPFEEKIIGTCSGQSFIMNDID